MPIGLSRRRDWRAGGLSGRLRLAAGAGLALAPPLYLSLSLSCPVSLFCWCVSASGPPPSGKHFTVSLVSSVCRLSTMRGLKVKTRNVLLYRRNWCRIY